MKISEEFPSKYLKAAELQGREVRVTMANVEREEVGTKNGQPDLKPVVYFKGKDRGVVLNKTNCNVLADAYGDDTEEWFGQDVILFSLMTEFQGKATLGLRVRIPTARDNKPKQVNGHVEKPEAPRRDPISSGPQRVMADDGLDDSIPF